MTKKQYNKAIESKLAIWKEKENDKPLLLRRVKQVLTLFVLIAFSLNLQAQCPLAKKNCTGDCGRFIDKNSDGYCDLGVVEIETQTPMQTDTIPSVITKKDVTEHTTMQKRKTKPYHLIPISLITTALYLISTCFMRLKKIKKATHRKIWNTVLLISFLVSGLLGFFLIVQINYDVAMSYFATFLFWHVEVGIILVIVAMIHAFWHLDYYKISNNILKHK